MSKTTNDIRAAVENLCDCLDYFYEKFGIEENEGVSDAITNDIWIPAVKDCVMNSFSMMLWGRQSNIVNSRRGRVDYSKIESQKKKDKRFDDFDDLDELYFNTKEEAACVLGKLTDYAVEYSYVSVGYLFELIGEFSSYITEYYGWTETDLMEADILPFTNALTGTVRWQLKLPTPARITTP